MLDALGIEFRALLGDADGAQKIDNEPMPGADAIGETMAPPASRTRRGRASMWQAPRALRRVIVLIAVAWVTPSRRAISVGRASPPLARRDRRSVRRNPQVPLSPGPNALFSKRLACTASTGSSTEDCGVAAGFAVIWFLFLGGIFVAQTVTSKNTNSSQSQNQLTFCSLGYILRLSSAINHASRKSLTPPSSISLGGTERSVERAWDGGEEAGLFDQTRANSQLFAKAVFFVEVANQGIPDDGCRRTRPPG